LSCMLSRAKRVLNSLSFLSSCMMQYIRSQSIIQKSSGKVSRSPIRLYINWREATHLHHSLYLFIPLDPNIKLRIGMLQTKL
jgi:hypothetical protein